MTNDFLQRTNSDLSKVFAHLLGQEGKVVDNVLGTAFEVLTQLRVLSSYTHRTGIGVTLTHHDTAQHNEWQCTKRELIGSQHRHDNHVFSGL